jgi:hypothetical protein
MLPNIGLCYAACYEPRAGALCVCQRLLGRECFGADNEQGRRWIEIPCNDIEIVWINI